jgi:hypothetical protein
VLIPIEEPLFQFAALQPGSPSLPAQVSMFCRQRDNHAVFGAERDGGRNRETALLHSRSRPPRRTQLPGKQAAPLLVSREEGCHSARLSTGIGAACLPCSWPVT